MSKHLELGRRGEETAAQYLKKKGYKIIERNVNFPQIGELDLVAKDGQFIVLVEVKTRSSNFSDPADAVNFAKRQRLLRAAKIYLKKFPTANARFDVIEIIFKEYSIPSINHIIDAFDA